MRRFQSLRRNGWDRWHIAAALALIAAAVTATHEAWADILTIARRDEEASHIFLVPVVFAWLVWVRRGRLRQCCPTATWSGPLIAAAGWLISAVGYNHAIQSFWHGGAVVLLIGCLVSVVGIQVIYRFAPAFALLVFLVPIPGMMRQQIAIPLQSVTAFVSYQLFVLLDSDIVQTGNVLSINGVDVGIVEACNGMRMVFALIMVTAAFAFGSPLRWYVRLLILLASPLSAIASNVLRLVPTIWLFGNSTEEIAQAFHDISGWVMLVVAFLALYGILRLMQWAMIPVTRYALASD